MSKFSSINPAREIAATLTQHPDYEPFSRLSSVENFATRQYGTGGEVVRGDASHYLALPGAFNNHVRKCLIDAVRDFDPKSEGFLFEKLYERITQERLNIYLNNPDSYKEEIALKIAHQDAFGLPRDQIPPEISLSEKEIEERTENFNSLKYRPSCEVPATFTQLSGNEKYAKYHDLTQNQQFLTLFEVMAALQEEPTLLDYETPLGRLIVQDGVVSHGMGLYRFNQDPKQIARVDEITNLAATKALAATDEEEALKYVFVFTALRGYNLRSVTGALSAAEMSVAWLIVKAGLSQGYKMPGFYPYIEAALLPPEVSSTTSFKAIINKEVQDFRTANAAAHDSSISLAPDSFFDIPKQQQPDDFIIYLIETKRYRAQDLPELISSKIAQKVFNIAARKGDVNFFKMLKSECDNSPDFKQQFEGEMSDINREEIIGHAMEYGGDDILKLVKALKPSTQLCATETIKASPVAVNEIDI